MNRPISVSLITGFLGSGKTTLIRRLLPDPHLRGAVVLVNDLAPIGLDHLLLQDGGNEPILLANGCICCTVNKDLGFTLLDLLRRTQNGDLSPISQVLIETTGMADPIPIMRLLAANPTLSQAYALDRIVTVVSEQHGRNQIARHQEARLQVAVADFVIISHGTITAEVQKLALLDDIAAINPIAETIPDSSSFSALQLVSHTRFVRATEPRSSVNRSSDDREFGSSHDVRIACLTANRPLDWDRLVGWVEGLGAALGENLFRIKGTVTIAGNSASIFINGVQDSFYAPIVLPNWFDPTGGSQLVVIGRGIDPARIQISFQDMVAG